MQAAIDPFHPLLRVIDRYKHDVHQLQDAPPVDALDLAAQTLGHELPASLAAFLERWNGATLFRGALRIRALSELAPASDQAPDVVAFADGPRKGDRWAYAPHGLEGWVFGRWADGVFEPLHERFDRWLMATVLILDHNVHDPASQLSLRLDCDPDCGFLLSQQAEDAMLEGNPERARDLLRRATAADPDLVSAWERLGDSLMGEDTSQARFCYLKALRAIQLPAPYPSKHAISSDLIATLSAMFPSGDAGWERELDNLLNEQVTNVRTYAELNMVEAIAVELARVRLERHDRESAQETLTNLLERVNGFSIHGPCAEAVLLLADIEVDLGHHDSAERRLRKLRIAPPPLPARANLVLGRIAVTRQEPWAEEILESALAHLTSPVYRCEAMLLLAERHILRERFDEAAAAFNEANRLATQIGSNSHGARAALGLGDLLRNRGDGPSAELCYREAREQSGEDRELLLRVLLRRGDLYRLTGDPERAATDYKRAADGYAELNLPIREAWARARQAQLGDEEASERANELFKTADLAAGVAATDAIAGNPSRSLDWHLNRAAHHARDRANARRARPPLTRADADRPERRIGAHRMAIAACDVRVVETLSQELSNLARTLDLAAPRSTDPNLVRYVAAVDLLSAHRSYEAAEALLHQLLEVRPGGMAGKALIGAMARSPNAALVDGLLDAIEKGGEPGGIAAAAEVLGWRREPAAVGPLRKLVGPIANRTVRPAAIVALGRIGERDAIPDLLPALEIPELAEETSVSLLLLGEWQGVDFQAQALAAQKPGLTRSPGEVVGRYGGPSYLLLLMRTAELEGPAGVGALQGLGYLGDPRAVTRLIDATTSRDPSRSVVASCALEILTGHHEDVEEALLRNRWSEWWANNADHFEDGVHYRNGRIVDPGVLIERLADDDALVRRTTYDELVITTGQRLPFDAEGPYRVQVAHQAAWRAWWAENQAPMPPGRWFFHGEQIG